MDSQLTWKYHLKHLEKKSSNKLSILSALAGSTWGISTQDLRRTYLATVLPQFTYCASVWFVPNGGHGFKQKENVALTFMKNIQARAAKIIAGTFRSTAGSALDIELHLLPVQKQLDIALYDSMLRIITSPTYQLITSQRALENRELTASPTQHQQKLYAQLSPLHKLEIRYAAVFKRDTPQLERRIPYPTSPWWQPPETTIAANDQESIATHDVVIARKTHLVIYTDGSGIDGKVGASAVTLFSPFAGATPMIADRKQAYLGPLTDYTVYSGELAGLDLALKIVEENPSEKPVAIFTDNQAAIQAIKSLKQQSGQYLLQNLA